MMNVRRDATIVSVFDEAADSNASRTAVTCGDSAVSYAELKRLSQTYASGLKAGGVGTGATVGLHMTRSVELIALLLGILRAGGAYVAVPSDYPHRRATEIARLASCSLVVADADLHSGWPPDLRTVTAADLREAEPAGDRSSLHPDDLAYVIYTSGSTGKPKGVEITHSNLLGLVLGQSFAPFSRDQVFLQLAPLAFDASAYEIWGALLHGGELVLADAGYTAIQTLPEILERNRITNLLLTPALFQEVVHSTPEALRSLESLLVGGEAMPLNAANEFVRSESNQGVVFANAYGPTEATTLVSTYRITDTNLDGVPLGSPINGVRMYVLDEYLKPVEPGGVGEIHIAGRCLARGYRGQAGLTSASFVPDLFGPPGERMYRTGDFAVIGEHGEIKFLGRHDHQVKVRGYRVELREVEDALERHPDVRCAVVGTRRTALGTTQLVGWVEVVRSAQSEEILRDLRRDLPDYLVPSALSIVAELPLTASGKVDRNALEEPESRAGADSHELASDEQHSLVELWMSTLDLEEATAADDFFARGGDSLLAIRFIAECERRNIPIGLADLFSTPTLRELTALAAKRGETDDSRPRNDVDPLFDQVAEAWHELLQGPFSADDNFFSVGGDSLLAIRLVARLQEAKVAIEVEDILACPTLGDLVTRVRQRPSASEAPSTLSAGRSGAHAGRFDATELQLGLIFESLMSEDSTTYIDVLTREVRGPFRAELFERALLCVVARHPSLRTTFDLGANHAPQQVVSLDPSLWLEVTEVDEASEVDAVAAAQRNAVSRVIDVEKGPVLATSVAHPRSAPGFSLTYAFHHAVMDGWSESVFITELMASYDSLLAGVDGHLEPAAIDMSTLVELEGRALASRAAADYWGAWCKAASPLLLRPSGIVDQGRRLSTTTVVDPLVTAALREQVERTGVPLKSWMLAAHVLMVSSLTDNRQVLAGVVTNARPAIAGGDEAIGLFLNVFPIALRMDPGALHELPLRTFAWEREVMRFRFYPYPAIERKAGHKLFDNAFNYVKFEHRRKLDEYDHISVSDARSREVTNFALLIEAVDDQRTGNLSVILTVDEAVFSPRDLIRLQAQYLASLRELSDCRNAELESAGPAARLQT